MVGGWEGGMLERTWGEKFFVRDIMIENPITFPMDAPLREVAKTMVYKKIGSVVVAEQGRPVGIFTTIDALKILID